MACPDCGHQVGPLDTACPRCGRQVAPAGAAPQRFSADLDELVRAVLAEHPAEEGLDEALTRLALARYPGVGGTVADGLRRQLDATCRETGCSRLEAARRLAQGQASVTGEVTTRTYHSLEEVPPELRERVERARQGKHSEPGGPQVVVRRRVSSSLPGAGPVHPKGCLLPAALSLLAALGTAVLLWLGVAR